MDFCYMSVPAFSAQQERQMRTARSGYRFWSDFEILDLHDGHLRCSS